MLSWARSIGRWIFPRSFRRSLGRHGGWPPVGTVRMGSLRRASPISRDWGFDRGLPIDRYYIERFLAASAADIRGRVLEIDTSQYTRTFGGDRVTQSDVLHISEHKPGVTLVGDLTKGDGLPSGSFDCVILTQTLQLTYDTRAVVRTVHRMLKPGGVALVTMPGISKMTKDEAGLWGYHWGFTSLSAQKLFGETFPADRVRVTTYGNVLTAAAFLYGLASRELHAAELDHSDPDFELLICVRAAKPAEPA